MAKVTEKRLYAVPPQSFTSDGTQQGQLTVADTRLFCVGQLVKLASNTQSSAIFKIKRITDLHTIFVGPEKAPIQDRSDISMYLVADGATISAAEQNRPSVAEQEIERLTYAEEPTVARRVTVVDELGNNVNENNPLPVTAVFDGDVKVGDIRITAHDNDPAPGDIHSDVRINDGNYDLKVNPDGSINVVIPPGAGGIPVNEFNQIAAVPANSLTTVLTYTVPPPYKAILYRVEVGGNNVATFELYINSVIEGRHRTWFSGPLTGIIEFSSGASGFELNTGDVVEIKVIHTRPFVGDFEARLQAQLQ